MKIDQPIHRGIHLIVVMLGLACSPLAQLSTTDTDESLLATRTPLPTFTATSSTTDVVLLPTATEPPRTPTISPPTPTPPATNTPPPPELPEEGAESGAGETDGNTDEAAEEEESTETQEVSEPTPLPTAPPPPTPEPSPTEAPPAEPAADAHGVIGKITFRDGHNTYAVGEKVFVKIEATNTQPGQLPFGILGLTTSNGAFQTSWSSGTIDGTFNHEDGLAFSAPGDYKMWLSICFSTETECQGADGDWERFEPGLDVTIQ